jgi:hypothetical protein
VDAFTIGGAMLKPPGQPPYPINVRTMLNVIDKASLVRIVNALVAHFDEIKFGELSWSYWYAICSPLHTAAINFGGLIEQFLRRSADGPELRKLLGKMQWEELKAAAENSLKTLPVAPEIAEIIRGKIGNLNEAPPDLILKRTFYERKFDFTVKEAQAWRNRNIAAHGGVPNDPVDVILNSKVLRVVFHRLIAATTACSDQYIDYYNFDFPHRPLAQGVPAR